MQQTQTAGTAQGRKPKGDVDDLIFRAGPDRTVSER